MDQAYSEMIYNILREHFKEAPEEKIVKLTREMQRDPRHPSTRPAPAKKGRDSWTLST